jgi:hypothetical protein
MSFVGFSIVPALLLGASAFFGLQGQGPSRGPGAGRAKLMDRR